jgi:glucan phosphoethanolaminetransferase (alkaline phosphatase superfamily)
MSAFNKRFNITKYAGMTPQTLATLGLSGILFLFSILVFLKGHKAGFIFVILGVLCVLFAIKFFIEADMARFMPSIRSGKIDSESTILGMKDE